MDCFRCMAYCHVMIGHEVARDDRYIMLLIIASSLIHQFAILFHHTCLLTMHVDFRHPSVLTLSI